MRYVIPLLAVLCASLNVALSRAPISHESKLCELGLCRFDQINASIEAEGLNAENIQILLKQNPANPFVWATYAEFLASQGDMRAPAMYDHALELGPDITAVLMRTANFDFTHDRLDHGLAMTRKILNETNAFDQILFSYLTAARLSPDRLLGKAIPPDARAASAWWNWIRSRATPQELDRTWAWMSENSLVDEKLAIESVAGYWQRREYLRAQEVWRQWLGDRSKEYLNPELIWNPDFALQPTAGPMDWRIQPSPAFEIERKNGLEIRFLGLENISFSNVQQSVPVRAGQYEFSVDLEASTLTTDRQPFLRVGSELIPIEETSGRITIRRKIAVSQAGLLEIRLERQPSEKFDNKLRGTVHLYAFSLKPL